MENTVINAFGLMEHIPWTRLEEALNKSRSQEHEDNNNLKTSKEMNLQMLKDGKTTEFDSLLTPVMDYINENYKEYKDELTENIVNEILQEIEKKHGKLAYISNDNRLIIKYGINRFADRHDSKKVGYYEGSLRVNTEYSEEITNPTFEQKFSPYLSGCWDCMYTWKESIDDLYIVKDPLALIEFLNKEQEDITEEKFNKQKEKIAEDNKYLELAKKFNFTKVNRTELDKLVMLEEIQTKGISKMDTKELLESLRKVL